MAATKARIYGDAIRHLADASLATITDDVEARYELDNAWDEAVAFVLRQAAWRYAIKTVALSSGGSTSSGYSLSYTLPADAHLIHAIWISGGTGRECPFDFREQQGYISTNSSGPVARYVSSDFLNIDAHAPPEHVAQLLAAYLAFLVAERVTGERGAATRMSQLFSSLLPEARRVDALDDNPWLPYQRNGDFLRATRTLLSEGFWRFALEDATITVTGGIPARGFAYSFVQPTNWLRTYKVFLSASDSRECPIDAREQGGYWSANVTAFNARYVSQSLGFDSRRWDETFTTALLGYLTAGQPQMPPEGRQAASPPQWYQAVLLALDVAAEPPDPLLPHQFDGSFLRGAREVLSAAPWRFALKQLSLTIATSPTSGYAYAYSFPPDHLRTHAIMLIADDGSENPFDVKQHGAKLSSNREHLSIRYVSSDGLDSRIWPEPFTETLRAYYRYRDAKPDTAAEAHKDYLVTREGALETDAVPPDPWLRHILSGNFYRVAREIGVSAFWRFAMLEVLITASGAGTGGYAHSVVRPADWLGTRQLYRVATDGRRMPVDVRERGASWLTDEASFWVDYLSEAKITDSAFWPEPFRRAVLYRLEFAESADARAGDQEQIAGTVAKDALADALAVDALEVDPWLPHQLNGRFRTGSRVVMQQGYWAFRDPAGIMRGLKEVQLSALDDQSEALPAYAFPYRFPLPADWFKTRALFVPFDGQECPINIRETAHEWSTDAPSFVAQYVGTDVLNPTLWPDTIASAVLAYLDWQAAPPAETKLRAEEYAVQLAAALKAHSRPQDDFLRFQLDGRFESEKRKLIESGRWRFAVKTVALEANTDPLPADESDGTVSDSYAYRFMPPNDLVRTLRLYYTGGFGPYAERQDIDYRDEQGAYHTNYAPISVRYISRLAYDSTKWPAAFMMALRAYLLHIENPSDPILKRNYEDACAEAEHLDDARDRPLILRSRFVAARRGFGYARGRDPNRPYVA